MCAKRKSLPLIIVLVLLFLNQSIASEKPYILSVVPQFTGTAVHRDWSPIIKHIESKTGFNFKLKIYDSIQDFEKGFLIGTPDFAYMNPYHVVMANEAQGYLPILRNSQRLLSGIMVVRKDSPINNIEQLTGTTIAFPSPNAFAASLYMRALLNEKEHIDFTPVYAGTHSNAYRQVLIGQTAAAGAVRRTLLKERKEVQENLKVIYKTPAFPSHPLTVHKRVPENVKTAVQSALLDLNHTQEGKKQLNAILLSNPIEANFNIDYLPLKALNLDAYLIHR